MPIREKRENYAPRKFGALLYIIIIIIFIVLSVHDTVIRGKLRTLQETTYTVP